MTSTGFAGGCNYNGNHINDNKVTFKLDSNLIELGLCNGVSLFIIIIFNFQFWVLFVLSEFEFLGVQVLMGSNLTIIKDARGDEPDQQGDDLTKSLMPNLPVRAQSFEGIRMTCITWILLVDGFLIN